MKNIYIKVCGFLIFLLLFTLVYKGVSISVAHARMSSDIVAKSSYPWDITGYKNYDQLDESYLGKMVTLITTTNPRPTHPSPDIITETIRSTYIDPKLFGVRHIIAADGCPTQEAMLHKTWHKKWDPAFKLCPQFKKFLNNVFTGMKGINIDLLVHPEAVGLGKSLKRVMDFVDTPYVFVQQDDMPMVKSFNMTALILTMEADPNIRYVRFGWPIPNNFDRNLRAYENSGLYGIDLVAGGNAVDHNQVVRADYYRECLGSLNESDYDFRTPEGIFYSEPECSPYGYLYGNIKEYSPMTMKNRYIGHLDGRKTKPIVEKNLFSLSHLLKYYFDFSGASW